MDKIAIGKVRTSIGVRGYFKILSYSGESAHFKKLKGKKLEFVKDSGSRFFTVEDVRMSGANLTMKVEEINSPEDAKKFSGWNIVTEKANAAALKPGEYYSADLCGCMLVDQSGAAIGKVKSVCDNSVSDLLEVETEDGVRLIPFMDRYVGRVDIDSGTIELIEEWLLQ